MRTPILISTLVVVSFLLGFIRDILVAKQFGSSWHADLLFVALILPVFFENLLGLALRDAMIPHLKRIRMESLAVYSSTILVLYRWSLYVGVLIALIAGIGVQWWLPLLAPGWSAQQVAVGIPSFVIGAALIAVQTLLYTQTAFLNVSNSFILPMWRTVLFNFGGIAAMLIFKENVEAILIGMLVAQIFLLVLMHYSLPEMRSTKPSEASQRHVSFLGDFSFVLVATAAQQICVVAERLFASFLEEGSIALLSFAFRLTTIPLTLFSFSILAILYPSFSDTALNANIKAYRSLMRKGLKITLVFLVPAAVLLAAKPDLVVSVLLERGQFGEDQTLATAPLVVAYAFGLPGFGLALLWGRVLISQHGARLFFASALVTMVLTVTLDAFFSHIWGATGLATAFSIGGWVQACLCGYFVFRIIPGSIDMTVFFRWIFAGGLTFLALNSLSLLHGVWGLVCACLIAMSSSLGLLLLLGERELFNRSFWMLRSSDISPGFSER